jgi:glycosyltransferase involved in cell wall biosynthesis
MVVKDEADIVASTIVQALRFCEQAFVLDNGSSDGTFAILKDQSQDDPRLVILGRSDEPFSNALYAQIYNAYHKQVAANSWWLILDADEILEEDPRPLLAQAARARRNVVFTAQAQFYFTLDDCADEGTSGLRIVADSPTHYAVNWLEPRFFRNDPTKPWRVSRSSSRSVADLLGGVVSAIGVAGPLLRHRVPSHCRRAYWRCPVNRHYQYRSDQQIARRLELRAGQSAFVHVTSTDIVSVIKPGDASLKVAVPSEAITLSIGDCVMLIRVHSLVRWRWAARTLGRLAGSDSRRPLRTG